MAHSNGQLTRPSLGPLGCSPGAARVRAAGVAVVRELLLLLLPFTNTKAQSAPSPGAPRPPTTVLTHLQDVGGVCPGGLGLREAHDVAGRPGGSLAHPGVARRLVGGVPGLPVADALAAPLVPAPHTDTMQA
jgi:hypothetical protein